MKHGESFGVKLLEKYGWEEGKGLGAKEDGISDAIKPNLKFDKHGLGHDISKDIAYNWWDGVFNKALNTVGKSADEMVEVEKEETKKRKAYTNFVKRDEVEELDSGATNDIDTLSHEMVSECEGRTAHKGARHGVYSSSKLDRVKRAEEEFLSKYNPASSSKSAKKQRKSPKRSSAKPKYCNSTESTGQEARPDN